MADGRANNGGYRAPANPAPVSGPGALSKRTDGGPGARQAASKLPNAKYGEQKDFQEIQSGAPMEKGGAPVGTLGEPATPTPSAPPPPLDAPSQRPGEVVTSGADAGAGLGSDALGLLDYGQLAANDLSYVLKYLPDLQFAVDMNPDTPTSTLAYIRFLRSQV